MKNKDKELRSEHLDVLLTSEIKDNVRNEAAQKGLTMSGLIYSILFTRYRLSSPGPNSLRG